MKQDEETQRARGKREMMILTREMIEKAVIGGAILGGGGGGSRANGLRNGGVAVQYGEVALKEIDEVPEDAVLVTASAVGAPAAKQSRVLPCDYVRAMALIGEKIGSPIGGVITNENGGAATVNGLIQSAVLNIPLIDAPCNGRAHPMGVMGSMGLHLRPDYISHQAAVGGDRALSRHIETVVSGSLDVVSKLVRQAAVLAGGLIAVARNPVPARYVRENGAVGGVSHAIRTGEAFIKGLSTSPEEAIKRAVSFLGGEIIVKGNADEYELKTEGGFDVGLVTVAGYEMTFWNEYMTLEKDGVRQATFPDLIMTFDAQSGYPLTTAEIEKGQPVAVAAVNRGNLRLGAAMRDMKLMAEIEPITGKEIVKYLE